jgi:hypothetical protein
MAITSRRASSRFILIPLICTNTANFRNGGPDTNERLQIRGLVEISDKPPEGGEPYYGITTAGKVEWHRLSTKSD